MIEPYFQNDHVTLYHGDCLDILPQLDIRADLLLTDPPYSRVKPDEWDRIGHRELVALLDAVFYASSRLIADAVFENDDYFTVNGVYKFNPADVPKASATCFNACRDAMESGTPRIAVANVFADAGSMAKYRSLAEAMGYSVVSLIVENRDGRRTVHSVAPATIEGMRARFEVKLC